MDADLAGVSVEWRLGQVSLELCEEKGDALAVVDDAGD